MQKLLALSLLCPSFVFSQHISTYFNTNNNGIYSVLSNPANAAGSTDWLSINIIGAGTGVENNVIKTRLAYSMAEIAILKPLVDNQPAMRTPVIETSGRRPKNPGFFINTQALLPSVKLNITPKVSALFFLRERIVGNIVDAGQDLLSLVVDKRIPLTVTPALQMDVRLINLQETGLGISAVVFDQREAMFKVGVTMKRSLSRFACLVSTSDFAAAPAMNGVNISGRYRMLVPDFNKLTQDKMGFAFGKTAPGQGYSTDIGAVYEYRPYHLKHRYRVTNPRGGNKNFRQRDLIKYVYRIGVSVLDIGYLDYSDKSAPDKVYEVSTSVDPRTTPDAKKYMEDLTTGARVISEKSKTRLYLPTTCLLTFDYRINSRWFLNVAYSQNLRNRKKADVFYIPTTVTGMVRKEFRNATHGIPLRIVPSTRTATVGWFTQAGPFFIGTDNVLTFFKRGLYNWSVYTGICITLKYKKDPTIENFKTF